MLLASLLKIPLSHSFGEYLGCPILNRRPKKSDFKFVIDKIYSKLAGWKTKCVAMLGRVTLIKYVNRTIPAYVMQNVMLPKGVHKAIDKANRDFLWESSENERKIHSVGWDKITKPTDLGGLGIRKSYDNNIIAMAKLNWRMNVEDKVNLVLRFTVQI
ncbi:hypothetical protein RHMOL_Rhmol01G0236900 [Rhododendron molle]|uniref:Uncharacterized protein n=1 Tax=Rhododendron molle TaxID=49168 RepID=A0ACC0Q4I8_RHOML|nr:hypothetical protein RHMOL_Rhmol01G0236900 [Rhododendron molle]